MTGQVTSNSGINEVNASRLTAVSSQTGNLTVFYDVALIANEGVAEVELNGDLNNPSATPIQFEADGSSRWAGMGHYCLLSPGHTHVVELEYVGEPPFGDSYHRAFADGIALPGFMWGCMFAFSPKGRFFVGSWMRRLFERLTLVVDCDETAYLSLPKYISDFRVSEQGIYGMNADIGVDYRFTGRDKWVSFDEKGL